MQPLQYYKFSGLADPTNEALSWLASRLKWERTLDRLRTKRPPVQDRKQAA